MKTFVLLVFSIFSPLVSFGQTSLKEGPKINGIGLGARREQVVAKFGKPLAETKKKADECVGGTEVTLQYPGLKFRLWDDPDNPKSFTVGWFEVRSARWNVSGAKIGDTTVAVRNLFGVRTTQQTIRKTGSVTWFYEMDEEVSPGTTNFTFRNGKLVGITTLWLLC
ncbi:MAG TPA: hypothetical protein PKD26_06495 [Pyrinomonadaceae bacterium]|nr:hypothetical protein [Pyrinomonadaceae bacterium]